MPDPKRIRLLTEGDDDRAVLTCLVKQGCFPAHVEVEPRPQKSAGPFLGGKEYMVSRLLRLAGPEVGGRAIALRDLDDLTLETMASWFEARLNAELGPKHPSAVVQALAPAAATPDQEASPSRTPFFEISAPQERTAHCAVVSVGLPDDALGQQHGITEFAMDDYLLRLVCEESIYTQVTEFH